MLKLEKESYGYNVTIRLREPSVFFNQNMLTAIFIALSIHLISFLFFNIQEIQPKHLKNKKSPIFVTIEKGVTSRYPNSAASFVKNKEDYNKLLPLPSISNSQFFFIPSDLSSKNEEFIPLSGYPQKKFDQLKTDLFAPSLEKTSLQEVLNVNASTSASANSLHYSFSEKLIEYEFISFHDPIVVENLILKMKNFYFSFSNNRKKKLTPSVSFTVYLNADSGAIFSTTLKKSSNNLQIDLLSEEIIKQMLFIHKKNYPTLSSKEFSWNIKKKKSKNKRKSKGDSLDKHKDKNKNSNNSSSSSNKVTKPIKGKSIKGTITLSLESI